MSISLETTLATGEAVKHLRYGSGDVVLDQREVVLVRFGQELKSVSRTELQRRAGVKERFFAAEWEPALELIHRAQALAIRSLHDEWGVFAASRIELLPHQLWVCRQVNSTWPTRYLVADDVGLGKSVEAGMILSPLLGRGTVKRLLILCPANLVAQWQRRMKDMFDIGLVAYSAEADTARSRFWDIHPSVVASFHTLRIDQKDRHSRIMASEPWDMVIVDEAHHLNNDEATGPTLGYRLLRDMDAAQRIVSMIFFTGTPHRGKDFNFLSLLSLLRPDWFTSEKTIAAQLARLPDVLIRNNKANATDLKGRRLFAPLQVEREEYAYSPEEDRFYHMMTDFVTRGQAYAGGLNRTQGEAVMLVLITLQKLASSSVAAVRRAITRRIARVEAGRSQTNALQTEYDALQASSSPDGLDRAAVLEEELAAAQVALQLMENEESALRDLQSAADEVHQETKILAILRSLDADYEGRSVLFFTEYKATQALVASALIARFGEESVTFINGDGLLTDVVSSNGTPTTLSENRELAAERFNNGEVRFLISTEAAGEGIDLQRSCHTLIHVDLPWNPMRLHQRVGRLYRYGQREAVQVRLFQNPATVESRIWEQLNDKLARIGIALAEGMDEPEEIGQLVLGMTSPRLFNRLYSRAPRHRERFDDWFNRETATFGGADVAQAVQHIVGSAKRFDFAQMSRQIPQATLSDLRPFFELAITLGNRRVTTENKDLLSFITPDEWRNRHPAIRPQYSAVTFDWRTADGNGAERKNKPILLGVGHPLMDVALELAGNRAAAVAALPADVLPAPLFMFRIYSRESVDSTGPQPLIAGVSVPFGNGEPTVLSDADLLALLNTFPTRRPVMSRSLLRPENAVPAALEQAINAAEKALTDALSSTISHRFRFAAIEILAIFWPALAEQPNSSVSPAPAM